MLEIYVAHSRDFDYKTELYAPLRNSTLNSQYRFILPHETDEFVNSKEIIRKSNLVIAEVSYPATGEGIELGWADSFLIPILCLYKEGAKPSGSLKAVTNTIVSYSDIVDMINKIESFLSQGDFSVHQVVK
ncbi:hypothetical protein A2627_03415 [Candidatus Woesebacteria bacterium RIFCSPHIGHO2_01_FULL_39_28]|uniref:Nucleoside 2-deoxyribosyltransferase n=1 Tax=Candidatus Woesebacteria bacterium RIFCSPHIGHO2_01_FULL_39_28 TaxID=1802496 RepID=A0A1F7YK77_9BACT|nr:MAG: hypothetical protein A2627_03415 [Candidatus Woesebacteria bacterium RIFCSPHIGHO2_01_FULL_39_28]